jgi:cbb3-type cytochrome oxidase subunit 1
MHSGDSLHFPTNHCSTAERNILISFWSAPVSVSVSLGASVPGLNFSHDYYSFASFRPLCISQFILCFEICADRLVSMTHWFSQRQVMMNDILMLQSTRSS